MVSGPTAYFPLPKNICYNPKLHFRINFLQFTLK